MSQAAVAVEGERIGRCGDPCVMVIFGAAGDLTRRKLIPSLYNLAKYNLLAVPVVDEEKRLLGIVTVDDAIDLVLPHRGGRHRSHFG